MAAAELPSWIQEISLFAVGAVSVILAVWKYVKTQGDASPKASAPNSNSQVISASFVDSKLLRELIDALREHSEEHARIALRITRSNSETREDIKDLAEAVRMQTDASLNLVRFLTRQLNKGESDGV